MGYSDSKGKNARGTNLTFCARRWLKKGRRVAIIGIHITTGLRISKISCCEESRRRRTRSPWVFTPPRHNRAFAFFMGAGLDIDARAGWHSRFWVDTSEYSVK